MPKPKKSARRPGKAAAKKQGGFSRAGSSKIPGKPEHEKFVRKSLETQALLEGSRAVLEAADFEAAANRIFGACKKITGAAAGYIALLSRDKTRNEVAYLDGGPFRCTVPHDAPMPIRGFRKTAYQLGKAVYDNNFEKSKHVKLLPKGHVPLKNVLFAPLKLKGETVGLLGLGNKPAGFDERDARIATAFAELAAIALNNSWNLERTERSEEQFRSVVESAMDAIITIDNKGKIVSWNRAAESLFGYRESEISGRPLAAIMPARFRKKHEQAMERAAGLDDGASSMKSRELTGLRKDGAEFPLELSLARWTSREGVFHTGIIHDLSGRKRVEQELKAHRDHLEEMVGMRTKELVARNELFESVFSTTHLMIAYLDPDFNFIKVNRAYARAGGHDERYYAGKNHFQLYPHQENEAIFRKVVSSGIPYTVSAKPFGYPEHPERGATYWDWTLYPVKGPSGKVEGLLLSLLDVTEGKRTEHDLRIARRLLNELLEMMPVYVVLLTPDYHVRFANRFFRERFGEDKGRRCYEYLFGRTAPCELCETYTAMKTNAPHYWEWTGPDNRNYDIYDFPFIDADGSTLIMEVGIDITERKQAEEKVRAMGKYNRSLIEASLDPLVTIDKNGKITDVNSATESVTGRPRKDLIGADFSDCFTEPEKARAVYKKVLKEGYIKDYALDIRHCDGRITPVLYNASVYLDDAGKAAGVFADARDISERKRLEAERKKVESELEKQRVQAIHADRLRSLGEMAASIAHELNQPLVGMRGLAEHIAIAFQRGWDLPKQEILEKANLIVQQADRMSHVVEHTRMFGRLGDRSDSSLVSVNEAVDSSLVMIKPMLRSHEILLETELAPGLPRVLANPFSVEEIIINLISNARDAIAYATIKKPGPGKIKIRTGLDRTKNDGLVIIEIIDNGCGIQEENLDKIFEPFFSTKDADKGTGLGLPISKNLVEGFGGRIEIRSRPGAGTAVAIYLPAVVEDKEEK